MTKLQLLVISLFIMLIGCKNSENEKTSEVSSKSISLIQDLDNPVTGNSSLPRLSSNDGKLFMSWVEQKDSLSHLNFSTFEQGNWSDPETIISGSDWFVNWADFPAIAENNGKILASFLQKSADGTYTYDVKLNLFSDGEWKKNFILHDDGTFHFVRAVKQRCKF